MRDFKSLMCKMQGQNKTNLRWLYVDSFSTDPDCIEDEKVFNYNSFSFWFQGTGRRSAERILMMIALPVEANREEEIPVSTFLLKRIGPIVRAWSEENQNDNKAREKAQFFVQAPGNRMLRRNGLTYDEKRNKYVLRLLFQVPLINGVSVNGKAAARAVSELLALLEECMLKLDHAQLEAYVNTYQKQQQIREFLREKGYCAFVANGSILPREKDGDAPMQGAIPFVSPKECEITIELKDHSATFRGMGIPSGITVITGGGYSGKSTLLDSLEAGIYDHVPGDGREYVIAERSALKVYAEDGRPVSELDLSAFFKFLPGKPLESFSTEHASGSVSQASSILEAVSGGSRLLLIDEDKSATNFMIRDRMMRLLVEDEPIIPFTERITELWKEKGVSTILVIGGSSEYLRLADQVILMKDFRPSVITEQVRDLIRASVENAWNDALAPANWIDTRRLLVKETSQPFLFFRTVETENEKKVILDEFSADVTMLTALSTHEQLCTLTIVMERLLTDPEGKNREILVNVQDYLEDLLIHGKTGSIMPETQSWFYEEIRPLDALCCINRMRGAEFGR
ncbi:MAG: ABC-ATPase domain-containing protein [Acetatifactor sp.]|nr:ABC-ATPase domain-containing protein [Acetatifactor sp.]